MAKLAQVVLYIVTKLVQAVQYNEAKLVHGCIIQGD